MTDLLTPSQLRARWLRTHVSKLLEAHPEGLSESQVIKAIEALPLAWHYFGAALTGWRRTLVCRALREVGQNVWRPRLTH